MKKLLTAIAVIALIALAAPAFANPFVDVPAGHWAYDSIAHLASRGMISGYPDGSFKGSQPMTRYEMASLVGRAVAGMESANAEDSELIKKLVLEFKNELDALGVKVADLDKRVAVLEDGVGGWKLRGVFYFDAKFGSSEEGNYFYTDGNANQFTKERFRLFLTKTIDENTQFYGQYRVGGKDADGQGDASNGFWSHLYLDTQIFYNMAMRVGRFTVDFEDDHGLYTDNDALFGDFRVDGIRLKKSFGILDVTGVVGRNAGYAYEEKGGDYYMHYALDANLKLGEKAMVGATGYWSKEDGKAGAEDVSTYGVYAGYDFTPAIGVKGIYYFQDYADLNNNAWKVALSMKQEALKFTSLWVEYSQEDNAFYSNADRYSIGSNDIGRNKPFGSDTTSKYLFVQASQQWNSQLNTFVRYAHVDFGTKGYDDATEWGVGIGYQYTPAVFFELAYDQIDHGNSKAADTATGKESVVRFRTTVSF